MTFRGLIFLFLVMWLARVESFSTPTLQSRCRCNVAPCWMEPDQQDKLKQLGFTEEEVQPKQQDKEPPIVKVNLINDVDPVTLTVIGFSLIALNFFVFANLGDIGIAGTVAKIINLSKQ